MYTIYVCLALEKDKKILLSKRCNTGWMDGYWHIPGGGVEEGEFLWQAVIREAYEEIGVEVDRADLKLMYVLNMNETTLGFYFVTSQWKNEPQNKEPDECSEIQWFDCNNLPLEISPYSQKALQRYIEGGEILTFL